MPSTSLTEAARKLAFINYVSMIVYSLRSSAPLKTRLRIILINELFKNIISKTAKALERSERGEGKRTRVSDHGYDADDEEESEPGVVQARRGASISENEYDADDEDSEAEETRSTQATNEKISDESSSAAADYTGERVEEETPLYDHDTESSLYGGGHDSDLDEYNFGDY